ncbi:hypothetical protein, partial [Pseudomonas sp. KCJK9044]|uniref:hypothetical protein n=1 Tax=Pseudomonas sp. KCJK9044 TaxID=3344562 RepID=UPI003905CEE5
MRDVRHSCRLAPPPTIVEFRRWPSRCRRRRLQWKYRAGPKRKLIQAINADSKLQWFHDEA